MAAIATDAADVVWDCTIVLNCNYLPWADFNAFLHAMHLSVIIGQGDQML